MKRPFALLLVPLVPVVLLAAAGAGIVSLIFGSGRPVAPPSAAAVGDIPADYLALYQQASASECLGLSWTVLAGVGKVESDHGRSTLPGVHSGANNAGAQGPMQFMPATFATYKRPIPAGGADPPSPYDPVDAIYAAARLLCADGALRDIYAALGSYSHDRSGGYAHHVLAWAAHYTTATPPDHPANDPTGQANQANLAIAFAYTAIGTPYEWGGNGPPADWGYDCSGLTAASYRAAGITLPRTAQQQYDSGKRPLSRMPEPGDLLFYGSPTRIHHVGLYIGNGQMINAPDFGLTVRIEPYRWPGDDYAGYTRPA